MIQWYMDSWSNLRKGVHLILDAKLIKVAKANAAKLDMTLSDYVAALLRADDWAFNDGWANKRTQRHRDLVAGNGWNTPGRTVPYAKHDE